MTIFGPTLSPYIGLPPLSLLSLLPSNPSTNLSTPHSHRLILNTLSHILTGVPLSFSIPSKNLTPLATQSSLFTKLEEKENLSVKELVEMLKDVDVDDEEVEVEVKEGPVVTGEVGWMFGCEGRVSVVDLLREELGLWDPGDDDHHDDDIDAVFNSAVEREEFIPQAATSPFFEPVPEWNNPSQDGYSLDRDTTMVDLPIFEAITLGQFLNIQDLTKKANAFEITVQPPNSPTPSTDYDSWPDDEPFLTEDIQEIVDILETMALEDS